MTANSKLSTGYTDHSAELMSGGVPVIMCHGAGGTALDYYGTAAIVPNGLAHVRVTSFGSDLGGQATFGNDDVIAAIDDVISWGAINYGTRTDKVAFWGYSMGALALNWVWRNPTKLAAAAFGIPCVALEAFHDKNPGSFDALVELAYGGLAGYQAALPIHDPTRNTALLAPLADKVRLFYAPDDTLIDPVDVLAFAAAVGCTAVNVGNVGHTLAWDQQQVLNYLAPLCWWA